MTTSKSLIRQVLLKIYARTSEIFKFLHLINNSLIMV